MEHIEPWRVSRPLAIIEGESLDGYVARIAAAHHFPRIAEITQLGGAEVGERSHAAFCDAEGLEAIAGCLRADAERLQQHAPLSSPDGSKQTMFGIALAKDHFQFTYRRFSPSALKASPHHRALWTLRLFPFCTETWEYLVDRCPNPACRRQQRWRRTIGIDLCDFCGEPLTRAEADIVPEELRENLGQFVDLVHPDASRREQARRLLPPELAQLDTDDLLKLACLIAPVVDHRAGRPLTLWTLSLDRAKDCIVPALARSWPLLKVWPHAFEELISSRINAHAKARGDGNWGASYRFLWRCRKQKLSAPVKSVVDGFAERCRKATDRGYTGQQVADLVGGQVSALVAMRRSGEIPSVLALDGQRLHVLFPKDDINKLLDKFQPRERIERAAGRLGIPSYAVRHLVDLGCLERALTPPGRSKRLTIREKSLSSFLDTLEAHMPQASGEYPYKLEKLMLRLGGGPKPWAAVLTAIANGELDAAVSPGSSRLGDRIHFRTDDILSSSAFADRPELTSNTPLFKSDLADMLSLSITNFSRYSDYLLGSGDHRREVSVDQALELSGTIISTTEIAARLQLHHTSAFRLASQRGVSVKSEGLFDRASAAELIPELFENDPVIAGLDPCIHRSTVGDAPLVMHAAIDRDGRIRLPCHLRNRLGLREGGMVEFAETVEGLLLKHAS